MIAIHIFFATLVFIFLYAYFKYKKYCDLINKIPGPRPQPIIGNFWLLNVSAEKLWNVFRQVNTCYYPIARYWLGPVPFIAIRHPDDLEIVLSSSKSIDKGFSYKYLYPWLKTGLVTSSGDKWHHRRQVLTPAFKFQILKTYLHIFEDNSKKFVEALDKLDTEIVPNLVSLSANYALNAICESSTGMALYKLESDTADEYKKAILQMREFIAYRVIRPFIYDWMFKWSLKFHQIQTATLTTLHNFTHTILENRKKFHKSFDDRYFLKLDNGPNTVDSKKLLKDNKPKLAMIDLLLKAEIDGMIDAKGIEEELDTLVFAGHDTTAMAIVFTIMLLAEHEEIQVKARQEVENIFSMYKDDLYLKIHELNYLERCIKESLRLFPPVHSVMRRLREDVKLTGTEIGCSIFDVHRDPNFWVKPTKYDPDRFLPENTQNRHTYAYIPFSSGPRNCIGQKFAIAELKCLIAHIILNFKLQPVTRLSDVAFKLDMVTRPSTPVYTKFVPINHSS